MMGKKEIADFPKGTEFAVGWNEKENCVCLCFLNPALAMEGNVGLVWRILSKEDAAEIADQLLEYGSRIARNENALN